MSISIRHPLAFHRPFWIDDLLCAALFMPLLNILLVLFVHYGHFSGGIGIFLAFLLAGSASILIALHRRNSDPLDFMHALKLGGAEKPWHVIETGLAASLPAVAAALAYALLMPQMAATSAVYGQLHHDAMNVPIWRIVTVLAIAPFWEELIFRGLVYWDLRRYFGRGVAMGGSAMVFALLHPVSAFCPVLVLGLCAARAAEKSRSLLAPMVTHAVYNAVVLWIVYAH